MLLQRIAVFTSKLNLQAFFLCCLLACVLGACSSSTKYSGKPVPEMTFAHVSPLYLDISDVEIENQYDPDRDPDDVSSSFPTPPDIALKRYADTRLKASGAGEDTLKFVIEDARVMHNYIEPEGGFSYWTKTGGKDHYNVKMRLKIFKQEADGDDSTQSILKLERAISIPDTYSLSEREMEQLKFLEMLMNDVDKAVTDILVHKLNLQSKT